jgi:hypothetical protein
VTWKKALGALALCALAAVACGPSFQAVYECDVHFEHCYAVDMSDLAIAEKRLCWREWLAGYTYGESRDRVEHARSRLQALSSDDPTSWSLDGAASGDLLSPGPLSHPVVSTPLPVNAFSPPPSVSDVHLDASTDGAPRDGGAQSEAALPGEACGDACARARTSCRDGCNGAACAACDHAYRSCMPPCFRDEDAATPPSRKGH